MPPVVPVSVNERLVPHLATRAECYVFPAGLDRAQWLLDLDTSITRQTVTDIPTAAIAAVSLGLLLWRKIPEPVFVGFKDDPDVEYLRG